MQGASVSSHQLRLHKVGNQQRGLALILLLPSLASLFELNSWQASPGLVP